MYEQVIEEAKQFIETLFAGNSGGHDVGHTLRVYQNAITIAQKETDCRMEIVALAALLHDVDDHKLFSTENNENARRFLKQQQVKQEDIESICQIINLVSFSKNKGRHPDTLEGRIVQDGDRLDAIGAIGIARAFAYGGEHGRTMESSIDHFHEKLLLLKDEMNTETGKEIAENRHQFLLDFLCEYEKEMKGL